MKTHVLASQAIRPSYILQSARATGSFNRLPLSQGCTLEPRHFTRTPRLRLQTARQFTCGNTLQKRKREQKKNDSMVESIETPASSSTTTMTGMTTDSADPVETMKIGFESVITALKTRLATLGPSERANIVSILERQKVIMPSSSSSQNGRSHGGTSAAGSGGGGGGGSSVPLGDLASVQLRGREVHLLVNNTDSSSASSSSSGASSPGGKTALQKAIDAAVSKTTLGLIPQAANTSTTPSTSTTSPSNLDVQVERSMQKLVYAMPIPTTETRNKAAGQTDVFKRETMLIVQDHRQKTQQALRKSGVGPDAQRRALERMEKAVKAANEEIKKIVEGARRVLLSN